MSRRTGLPLLVSALFISILGRGAAAAETGPAAPGFRLHSAQSQRLASARLVVVPGAATVLQQVPRLRWGGPAWSVDAQLALVQATMPRLDWSHAAVGRALLGGRAHLGSARSQALVLELGLGLDDAQAWGSHSVETTRGFGLVAGWEGSWTPARSTLSARVAGGLGRQSVTGFVPVVADMAFAWVFPVAEAAGLSGVLEVETQLVDQVPVSGRLLLRWAPAAGPWRVDLGGQASSTYGDDTGQGAVVAQVGRAL